MSPDLNALRQLLREVERVAVLTGAGLSAESGIPTFRGADGLWENYRATDLATPEAFARDPELVWRFYGWRRRLVAGVTCNPAHHALFKLEQRTPDFTLITQNVDGLHRLAGSRNLLELHGNLWRVRGARPAGGSRRTGRRAWDCAPCARSAAACSGRMWSVVRRSAGPRDPAGGRGGSRTL